MPPLTEMLSHCSPERGPYRSHVTEHMAKGGKYFEDLSIGETAERATLITAEMVRQFASFSGDDNPNHLDKDYAAKNNLPEPSVHGMLYVSLLSGVLGSELPGHSSIYLSQSVQFHGDVHIGDTLIARVAVTALEPETSKITLSTTCLVKGEIVLDGEAIMLLPRQPPN